MPGVPMAGLKLGEEGRKGMKKVERKGIKGLGGKGV